MQVVLSITELGFMDMKNKRPMGYMAHLRKQFNSINTYDYHNVN